MIYRTIYLILAPTKPSRLLDAYLTSTIISSNDTRERYHPLVEDIDPLSHKLNSEYLPGAPIYDTTSR